MTGTAGVRVVLFVAAMVGFSLAASSPPGGAPKADASVRSATKRPAACSPAQLPPGTPLGSARLRWTAGCIPFVRTPDDRFLRLRALPYPPHFVRVGEGLRMAYEDVGPHDGQVILLLHGEPTWSYLYRKMIGPLARAGYRVIAPDLIGMGRSDKPVQLDDYSYLKHVGWVESLITRLRLRNTTAFVQDWGSLIGLRVVGDMPSRFARIVVANGTLPVLPEGVKPVSVPDPPTPDPALTFTYEGCSGFHCFGDWATYALTATRFHAGEVVSGGSASRLSHATVAAYNAPFPSRIYMSGARIFPALLNTVGEAPTNAAAGEVLASWTKPLLTLFGDLDPIFGGGTSYQAKLNLAPGAQGQRHHTYPDASHFIQEDKGSDLARRVNAFIRANPAGGPG